MSHELQEIVIDFFKDVDDTTFAKIVDAFVYEIGTSDGKATKILTRFIKENQLEQALLDFKWNIANPDAFFRKGIVGTQMINDLKSAFLNAAFNRFRKAEKLNVSLESATIRLMKAELKYAKFHALECFESLNRAERYFYSKEEDAEIVERLEKIEI